MTTPILSRGILRQAELMAPAALVVGVLSYRNASTIAQVTDTVLESLDQYFAALDPVIVHVDGHSMDETLKVATARPLPTTVRRIATRYRGLSGKGSAIHALFTIAEALGAQAVAVVEADTVSVGNRWLPALLDPILANEAGMAVAHYAASSPLYTVADLILRPLLVTLFGLTLRYPTAGEIALGHRAVRQVLAHDVWETDIARKGLGIWMVTQLAAQGTGIAEVALPAKQHESLLTESSFVQEVGTLFRLIGQSAAVWQARDGAVALLQCDRRPGHPSIPFEPASAAVAVHAQAVGVVGRAPMSDQQWMQRLYEAILAYTWGQGDPDGVIRDLFPIFLHQLRQMLAEAERAAAPNDAWEEGCARLVAACRQQRASFAGKWAIYTSI